MLKHYAILVKKIIKPFALNWLALLGILFQISSSNTVVFLTYEEHEQKILQKLKLSGIKVV